MPGLTPAMLSDLNSQRIQPFCLLVALLAVCAVVGCATAPPAGPAFERAPAPGPGRARLYVFRIDPQHSLSTVEIAIDGHPEGRLGNAEYATFELSAGVHRLDFRQRGLMFASWGWNRQQIRPRSGETLYLEISVRVSAAPVAGSGQDLEIAGRESGSASENVFIQNKSEASALEALAGTTQRVP